MQDRIHVFLVEDSEIFSVLLQQKLCEVPELNIFTYKTAEEAINDAYLNPDIILLDYCLPGINGLEAMKILKNNIPDVPVLLISSQENPQLSVQALNAGAIQFIGKDFYSISEILDSIQKSFQEKNRRITHLAKRRLIANRLIFAMFAILAIGLIYYLT